MGSLVYLILCGAAAYQVDSLRRAYLSIVIGSSQHKEGRVCLDKNVDGRRCDVCQGDAQTEGLRP